MFNMLFKIAKSANPRVVMSIANYPSILEDSGINTFLRLSHFLAQAAHETDGFRVLEEYASGAAYEGRKDLGNVNPGDGVRYKGRGIFQLTGRANYKRYGSLLGVDLENNPDLAEKENIPLLVACEYWNQNILSPVADRDDIITITKKINGGTNGLESRMKYAERAKVVIAESDLDKNMLVAQLGDRSPFITWLQNKLNGKGAGITADGVFGAKTEAAVKSFQSSRNINTTGIVTLETLKRLRE